MTVPDSPILWDEFVTVTGFHISDEKNGETPPGGVESWTEHWTITMRGLRKARENHEKYVQYIIRSRAQAGLPKLPAQKRVPPTRKYQ